MKTNGVQAAMALKAAWLTLVKESEVNTKVLIYELLDFIDDNHRQDTHCR